MMGESGKRAAHEFAGEAAAGKKHRAPEVEAEKTYEKMGEEEDILAWLCAADEMTGELMKLLEDKDPGPPPPTTATTPAAVRFIEDPYSPLLVFQSSSSYVTINGNEETCGSSFSDSDASLMASVHTAGVDAFPGWTTSLHSTMAASGGAWGSAPEGVRGKACRDGTNGCDWDDETLARFLSEDEEEDDDGGGVWWSSIWAEAE